MKEIGDLMLAFGDADGNVHQVNTICMANTLINVGKNFDIEILLGPDHGYLCVVGIVNALGAVKIAEQISKKK